MYQCDDYLKLTYFNGRGRCEHIRLCLAAGNIVYEDKRISFDEWPNIKEQSPLGFLPTFEINRKPVLAQSMAIGRLVARLARVYGSDAMDQAYIDMIVETSNEFREGFYAAFRKENECERKEAIACYLRDIADPIFCKLNDLLPKGVPDHQLYFVGGKLSWADIHFYACTEIALLTAGITNLLDKWPKLKQVRSNVECRNLGIAKYLKSRPKTTF